MNYREHRHAKHVRKCELASVLSVVLDFMVLIVKNVLVVAVRLHVVPTKDGVNVTMASQDLVLANAKMIEKEIIANTASWIHVRVMLIV